MGRKVRRMKSVVSDGEAGGMVSDAIIEVFAEFFGLEAE